MELSAARKDWPLRAPFQIAYETIACLETVLVEVRDGQFRGRGEAAGVSYHGETAASMLAEIEAARSVIESGISRDRLGELLPPGGARNALDCALWDLEAKQKGIAVWTLAGLDPPRPCKTFFTLGLDALESTAQAAADAVANGCTKLKLKLNGSEDVARVACVRNAVPHAEIVVDANGSWSPRQLSELAPELAALAVKLIEQPLPPEADDFLRDYRSSIPLCADESCQTSECLSRLVGKYDAVCIKLDKTGGLTEALRLARSARERGFALMIGNMCGSSLAMAPAFLLARQCAFVDLDGPLLNNTDWADGIRFDGSDMSPPSQEFWG